MGWWAGPLVLTDMQVRGTSSVNGRQVWCLFFLLLVKYWRCDVKFSFDISVIDFEMTLSLGFWQMPLMTKHTGSATSRYQSKSPLMLHVFPLKCFRTFLAPLVGTCVCPKQVRLAVMSHLKNGVIEWLHPRTGSGSAPRQHLVFRAAFRMFSVYFHFLLARCEQKAKFADLFIGWKIKT